MISPLKLSILSRKTSILEPILILSGDKDFVQLQKFVNVDQYDPVRKRKINSIIS